MTDDIGGTLARWAKDGKPGQTLELLAMGVEVANLLLALEVLATADPGERALAGLSALGSVLDAVSAFNCVLRIGERAIKAVGAVSAAIDAFFAARDGVRAYEANDRSSAIGFGAVAFGSVLTMIGCTCAILGVGAAATGVGLPLGLLLEVVGAVIIAAGWLVAVLTADSDIEQFVSHCDFGVNFPSKSQAKPKWATREFAAWSDPVDGLDRQINSLMLLLASFKMHAADSNELVVILGLLTEDSKLRLRFKTQYAQARRDLTLTIDLPTKKVMHQGDPQDLSKVIVSDSGPQTVVTVTVVPPPDDPPPIHLVKCDCEVLLILDDKLTVPQNSTPFNFFVGAVQTATQPGPMGPDHSSYD